MRDYWLTQDLLKAAGFGFIAVSLLGIVLALWLPKKWWAKLVAVGFVIFAMSLPLRNGVQGIKQDQAQANESQAQAAKAKALFDERCKTAGEKIYKTVDTVDGVYLMKIRPREINFGDQFKLDDPYGSDLGGDAYIRSFLAGHYAATHVADRGQSSENWPRGYHFVEAKDPEDGQRYRYTGSKKAVEQMDRTAPNVQIDLKRNPNFDLNIYSFVHDRKLAPDKPPRYGVTYDDISTREEREYWIAGSSLKVVDLQTNEVIAERIGYMVDWAQGSRAGGRSPWLLAANNICPEYTAGRGSSSQSFQTTAFVEKVLKPSK